MKRKILTIITIIILIIITIITIIIIKKIQKPDPIQPLSFYPWSNEEFLYGNEARNEYISQLGLLLSLLSMIGIIPIILIPIFSSILLFFKKKYRESKTIFKILLFCIIFHLFSYLCLNIGAFNNNIYNPILKIFEVISHGIIIIPFIEAFLISYLIARNIYYTEKKN